MRKDGRPAAGKGPGRRAKALPFPGTAPLRSPSPSPPPLPWCPGTHEKDDPRGEAEALRHGRLARGRAAFVDVQAAEASAQRVRPQDRDESLGRPVADQTHHRADDQRVARLRVLAHARQRDQGRQPAGRQHHHRVAIRRPHPARDPKPRRPEEERQRPANARSDAIPRCAPREGERCHPGARAPRALAGEHARHKREARAGGGREGRRGGTRGTVQAGRFLAQPALPRFPPPSAPPGRRAERFGLPVPPRSHRAALRDASTRLQRGKARIGRRNREEGRPRRGR